MSRFLPDLSLMKDDRAVAPLIGFILLFGMLTVAYAGYQAEYVPQQNQEVEFEHLQEVENEMIEVRSNILRAGQTDVRELATVRLGTNYPTRLIALNPPDPVGTLQTSAPYNIIITNDTGTTVNVSTRFLKYQPGYSELPSNSVWYENSVLYREAGDNTVVIEDQNLVDGGDTVAITALQNDLNERGTGRVTLGFYPTIDFTADEIPDGNLTVTIPTRLDEDYWADELGEEIYMDIDTTDSNQYPEEINELKLNIDTTEDTKEFELNTVGIQSEPEEDETEPLKQGVGDNGGEGDSGGEDDNGGEGGNGNGDNCDEPPETDPDNTETFEKTQTVNLNGETKDSDVVFEGDKSMLRVKAIEGSDAVMGGLVVFKGGDGTINIDSSEDYRASVEDDIWMADYSELTGSGSLIHGSVCIGSRSSVKLETTEYSGAVFRQDVTLGDYSDITLESTEYNQVEVHGDISVGDNSESTGFAPLIDGSVSTGSGSSVELEPSEYYGAEIGQDVTVGDNSDITLESTEYFQMEVHGDVSMGDNSELTGVAPLIDGSVSVGSGGSVELATFEYYGAEIGQDVTYTGDGTLELIDTEYGDPQINGQVVIDDDDATVEFILESKGRFDDLDVVDGDGNVLDEEDDQVEITT